jgi:hypothetical protein
MVDATFTVDGGAIGTEIAVLYGASVALAVTDTTGAHTISWSVVGSSDSVLTNPTITPAGSPNGATASYTQVADPGTGKGASFGIQCVVTDSQGNSDTKIAVVGTENEANVVPGYAGEQTARDATHGWAEMVNAAVADNVNLAAEVDTTDATVTNVVPLALEDDTIYSCAARAVIYETGANTDTYLHEWTWVYQRQDAGAPSKIGADSDGGTAIHADDATWSVVVDVSGNTMRLRTTADAANACTTRVQLWYTKSAIA